MAVYTIKRFSADNDRENDERDAEFYDLVRSKKERNKKILGKGAKKGAKWGAAIEGALGAAQGGLAGDFLGVPASGAIAGGLIGAGAGAIHGGLIGAGVGAYRRHNKNKDLQDLKDQYAVATPEMRKKLIERLKRELADQD